MIVGSQIERWIRRVRRVHQHQTGIHRSNQAVIVGPAQALDPPRSHAAWEDQIGHFLADEVDGPLRRMQRAGGDGGCQRLESGVEEIAQMVGAGVEE